MLEEEENEVLKQLKLLLSKNKKVRLQPLHGICNAKVNSAVNKVNCVLVKIEIGNLTEMNNFAYGSAAYISKLVGDNKTPKKKKDLVEEKVRKEMKTT